MSFDLTNLSLKELKSLQSKVAKAILTFEDRAKQKALSELEEKARELGFSLAELTGAPVGRKGSTSAAKYANPANPSQTWSGRGRKPQWFSDALAAGQSAEDLAI
ncbi:H-NS histone family protein [Pseudogemmobacter sonorensis]|uniref:H-NS histone family protein n=1 Tax=Pseudogemmobacter sonorensis TaxID=2989681 RepID=UPI0036BE2B51